MKLSTWWIYKWVTNRYRDRVMDYFIRFLNRLLDAHRASYSRIHVLTLQERNFLLFIF